MGGGGLDSPSDRTLNAPLAGILRVHTFWLVLDISRSSRLYPPMTTNIAIIYGTSQGQTRKISRHIRRRLVEQDNSVHLFHGASLSNNFDTSRYDGFIIGASLRYSRFQQYIYRFIETNQQLLAKKPSSFFSVSATVLRDRQAIQQITETFLDETGWEPGRIEHFAGSLKYSTFSKVFRVIISKLRTLMRGQSEKTHTDYEYTDWESVDKFAEWFDRHASRETARKQTSKAFSEPSTVSSPHSPRPQGP